MNKITTKSEVVHVLVELVEQVRDHAALSGIYILGRTECGKDATGRVGRTMPSGITCRSCLKCLRSKGWTP